MYRFAFVISLSPAFEHRLRMLLARRPSVCFDRSDPLNIGHQHLSTRLALSSIPTAIPTHDNYRRSNTIEVDVQGKQITVLSNEEWSFLDLPPERRHSFRPGSSMIPSSIRQIINQTVRSKGLSHTKNDEGVMGMDEESSEWLARLSFKAEEMKRVCSELNGDWVHSPWIYNWICCSFWVGLLDQRNFAVECRRI